MLHHTVFLLYMLFCQQLTPEIIPHVVLFICYISISLFPPSFLNTSLYHQLQTVTTRSECELTDGLLLAAPCLPLKQIHHRDLDTVFLPQNTHPEIAPHIIIHL